MDITRDVRGRIVTIADFENQTIGYSYSTSGDLTSFVDRLGNISRYGYDTGREYYLTSVVDPLGREGARTDYDENARLQAIRNVRGATTSLSFDPNNLLVEQIDPVGRVTLIEVDQFGNIVTSTDAAGNQIRNAFDAHGRLIERVDPLGNAARYLRNSFGEVTQTIFPGHL